MNNNLGSTFGNKVIEFHRSLQPPELLPNGIEWINNLDNEDTWVCFDKFFTSYFSDFKKRLFLFGINLELLL